MNAFLVTCEHGGNRIPTAHRTLFLEQRALLDSHRGFDAGALVMARELAGSLGAPLVASITSRLLVDLNRSIGHRALFSSATRAAPAETRAQVLEEHYRPYRDRVEGIVRQAVSRARRAVHISSHSFTPELDGRIRMADVGLLYDPRRHGEVEMCSRWRDSLAELAPELRVRRNYPYSGKDDGLTSHLRKRFSETEYVGIELEINQSIVAAGGRRWTALRRMLIDSFVTATRDGGGQR
jgi:predicted N-formylglutamate amidohydrolase